MRMHMQTGFAIRRNATCSVQPILHLTHVYPLSVLTPTMLSFAGGKMVCIPHYTTSRCALQVTSSELLMLIVTLGGRQGTFQGGRHKSALDRHKELRLPWDPGGAVAAWGQAELQGGRGVSDLPLYIDMGHVWTVIWAWPVCQQPLTQKHHYKYARCCNWEGIQDGSGTAGGEPSPPT